MDFLKQLFLFSKREQIAIAVLLLFIFFLFLINIFSDKLFSPKIYPLVNFDSLVLQFEVESPEEKPSKSFEYSNPDAASTAMKLTPFPFNPNMLPEEDWKRIGLSDRQIKGIKNYEAKGGKFLRKEDVKKMYTISDAEYAVLEPFIVIPPPEVSRTSLKTAETKIIPETKPLITKAEFNETFELNAADSLQLIQIPGVGPWTSHRILQYRTILGGFHNKNQLYEVKGFDSLRFDQIVKHLVIDSLLIKKVQINKRTFKELLRHPYIDFSMTKTLINHREKRGFIKSIEELAKLEGFNDEIIEKLRPYVQFD
jgi:competence protein ComEA